MRTRLVTYYTESLRLDCTRIVSIGREGQEIHSSLAKFIGFHFTFGSLVYRRAMSTCIIDEDKKRVNIISWIGQIWPT